jgi:hypothetical protein
LVYNSEQFGFRPSYSSSRIASLSEPAAVDLASLSTIKWLLPLHEWKGRRSAPRIERASATALPLVRQRVGAGLRVLLERNAHEEPVDQRQHLRIGCARWKTASASNAADFSACTPSASSKAVCALSTACWRRWRSFFRAASSFWRVRSQSSARNQRWSPLKHPISVSIRPATHI